MLAIADGDRDSFIVLFNRLGPKIKTYLLRMGVPSASVEELIQETMLTIWRRSRQFDPCRGTGASWVYTIARNRWIDATRRERHPEVIRSYARATCTAPDSPEEICLQNERRQLVQKAFATLSPAQAAVVKGSMFGPSKLSEVAIDLGLPLGTAKSHLRRAIARLRNAIDETP